MLAQVLATNRSPVSGLPSEEGSAERNVVRSAPSIFAARMVSVRARPAPCPPPQLSCHFRHASPNAVPPVRWQACGHKHVLVNGKVCVSTHYLMRPGDIVEPAPGSEALFLRNARRRLANNNFVFKKDGPPSAGRQLASRRSPLVSADFERIMADGEAVGESYRRLPPARTGGHAASASDQGGGGDDDAVATGKSGWPAARQAQLDAIVPSLVCALAGKGSAIEGEMASRCET